jgi:hypothetical protein
MKEYKRENRRFSYIFALIIIISLICLGISLYLSTKYPLNPLENDIFQATNMIWKLGLFNLMGIKLNEYLKEPHEPNFP